MDLIQELCNWKHISCDHKTKKGANYIHDAHYSCFDLIPNQEIANSQ